MLEEDTILVVPLWILNLVKTFFTSYTDLVAIKLLDSAQDLQVTQKFQYPIIMIYKP